MTTYCAPCITDLALVREAVTAVSGTACCMAHSVLLTHPQDNPGRRRARLSQLRSLAESKVETAPVEDQPGLELLVHEYTLAGAMDMTGQPRPDGTPSQSRDRGAGDRGAGDRGAGDRGAGDRGAGDRGAGDRGAGDRRERVAGPAPGAGEPGGAGQQPREGRAGRRRRGRDRGLEHQPQGAPVEGAGVGPATDATGATSDGAPASQPDGPAAAGASTASPASASSVTGSPPSGSPASDSASTGIPATARPTVGDPAGDSPSSAASGGTASPALPPSAGAPDPVQPSAVGGTPGPLVRPDAEAAPVSAPVPVQDRRDDVPASEAAQQPAGE